MLGATCRTQVFNTLLLYIVMIEQGSCYKKFRQSHVDILFENLRYCLSEQEHGVYFVKGH